MELLDYLLAFIECEIEQVKFAQIWRAEDLSNASSRQGTIQCELEMNQQERFDGTLIQ